MSAPQTEVLITVDGTERARYVFEPGEYVLGRNPDCHIRVEADLVSRRHAKLTLNFDGALIEDLGSSNGTQVNGKPVTGSARLWPNQKIQVGAATIELRRVQGEPPTDGSLAPSQKALRSMLPSEILREKKYDIGAVIAKGGMGAILDAREAAIERKVAMKVMLDVNDADALARFIAEAKLTGQLEHPNIVPVHELGVDENGQPFYTMKMVRGITLKKVLELLAEGVEATVKKYPLAALLTVFQKVCDAVAFAHSEGVIHRDLKPENIMIGDYGEVLLMDWGLGKQMRNAEPSGARQPAESSPQGRCGGSGQRGTRNEEAGAAQLSALRVPSSALAVTLAGTVMGTPQYMAPEQARGEVGTLDARADIYALGAILYHILALRPPVSGTDAWEIVGKVGRGEIEPLECGGKRQRDAALAGAKRRGGALEPSVPASPGAPRPAKAPSPLRSAGALQISDSLVAVVRKAMALNRDARYRSVPELQQDIEAYQGGFATSAENAGAWKQLTLLVKRNKAASIGVAAVMVVGGVLGTKAIIEGKRAEREALHARNEAVRAGNEALRAERGEASARQALADLKKTAPQMRQLAESEAALQRFDSALEKLDAAIGLDPSHLPGYWRRAWLLLGMDRSPEAAAAIRLAQEKDPANAKLAAILPTVEQIAAAPAADRWNQDRASAVLAHLTLVGASGEAVALSGKFQLGAAGKLKLVQERVKQWFGKSVQVGLTSTGGIYVNSLPTNLDTLEPLRGLPISNLVLNKTRVTDLEPLRGMPLRSLDLSYTNVSDISPLRGMPLEELNLGNAPISDLAPLKGSPLRLLVAGGTRVSDLAPLRGMPLESLHLLGIPVRDLSPLKGMPLRKLDITGVKVTDLSPLQGMPLEDLNLAVCPATDLSPLRGMPLKKLIGGGATNDFSPLAGMKLNFLTISTNAADGISTLRDLTVENLNLGSTTTTELKPLIGLRVKVLDIDKCTSLRDLTPLLECTELEELKAMNCPAPIEPLRAHKTLKVISYSAPGTPGFIAMPVAQFWKEYDAQQAAAKK